jgi:hypothetical protein
MNADVAAPDRAKGLGVTDHRRELGAATPNRNVDPADARR